jgi:hypothetical protein
LFLHTVRVGESVPHRRRSTSGNSQRIAHVRKVRLAPSTLVVLRVRAIPSTAERVLGSATADHRVVGYDILGNLRVATVFDLVPYPGLGSAMFGELGARCEDHPGVLRVGVLN